MIAAYKKQMKKKELVYSLSTLSMPSLVRRKELQGNVSGIVSLFKKSPLIIILFIW